LADYPNLPGWLTRVGIYVAWIAVASLGVIGYVLQRRGRELDGLVLLGAYATLGLDGLLHYTRAPFSAHTTAMNFTILFEVVAATLTLIAVVALAARQRKRLRYNA
jgi:amino acid transporter